MKVKYFSDTDTALVEFTDNEVNETKEISENVYVDLRLAPCHRDTAFFYDCPFSVNLNKPEPP